MTPVDHAHHDTRRLARRMLLRAGAGIAGATLIPGPVLAAPDADTAPRPGTTTGLVDPYSGAIPLVFPLAQGTYQTPVGDNWHAAREGSIYQWNHRDSPRQRAHDGVDVYPLPGPPLPAVYAAVPGTIAAVCRRSANTTTATVTYKASAATPPPWDFSTAVDNVANLPLYGNFVWIRSGDPRSAGYFLFYCHLQDEATLRALVPDQTVTTSTAVGVMGDTGNAAGTPQLHAEIHYPIHATYTCTRCTRPKTVTSIDPYASLAHAAPR
jgi:murein DD-endopeptidase MepM/ murein hydrolase activator NlpD